jgi:hypothetical protein
LPPVFPLSNYAALQVLPRMARENPDPALTTESPMAVVASDDEARSGPRASSEKRSKTILQDRLSATRRFDDVHLSLLRRAN